MRIWRIKMWTEQHPDGYTYETYLYIDKTGKATKRDVRLIFWRTYSNDLFERPEVKIEYVRRDDPIELTAIQIVNVFKGTVLFKLNKNDGPY
jgi:hypothetical protein